MRVNRFVPSLGFEILGGLKIKDGLFLGDQFASQVYKNKFKHKKKITYMRNNL